MKKKKVLLVVFVIVVLMVGVSAVLANVPWRNEPEETKTTEPVKAVPLTINTKDEQAGKVTIYYDGEVAYEYEGPIKIRRRDGQYLIEVHSFSGSCSDE